MITLDSPVQAVLGDNKKAEKIVTGLKLRTVGDLLHHFPRRYLNTAKLTSVADLQEGLMLTVLGEIVDSKVATYSDRKTGRTAYRVEALLQTDGPRLSMTFFLKKPWYADHYQRMLAPGTRGVFIGKAGTFNNRWQLTHPQMVLFGNADDGAQVPDDAAMTIEALTDVFPIYPLTAGVLSWDLQRAIRFAREVVTGIEDPLPDHLKQAYQILDLREAFDQIHQPASFEEVEAAQRRFRFAEAVTLQLVLGRRRRALQAQGAQARTGGAGDLLERFDATLPFTLTAGQRQVGEEIERDLAQPRPMNRLLQGEVGSGKTLVALRAMLKVVDSGGQAALLAPTEVLAQQHYRSINAMLAAVNGGSLVAGGLLGGGTTVELLTGSMTKAQRTEPLSRIAIGEAGIVIGTHALLQDKVIFDDLGLVVVDEQHRFGVEQRAALTDKAGAPPHVLVMTATPIPRTVAMTVFGDLEVSTLTELPAGRAPIQTNLVPLSERPQWIDRVWERVREEVGKGHQAYVVAPRISGDDAEQGETDAVDLDEDGNPIKEPSRPLAAVTELAAELSAGPLHGLRVALLHGRLPPEEKERTMRAFAAGEIDVLVSTTVIEVGVDVANATAMVIVDAERFGVSQLHQLRGRVGRGGLPGLCLLVSHASYDTPARARLDAVASTTDGFVLSQVDLELRREGDVLGANQSGGRSSLRNLRVLRDEETIVEARAAAAELLDKDVDLRHAPRLAAVVHEIENSIQAEYMEKS
ncbi:ATP-dependent DNA helicase RecG [Nocardioides nematodiphilus]|uniref:ATP-dependent DNA helicase RecG n=1 Tax=Nocardioides nematodiphilus TaxID=2849669 RepID=UPI001CD98ECB|nr:ATP-dependent DNA helicase RecG [Nocardioides nematodiphilus]MCA1984465.1 ATP-dependent DNA helicase RecG [Nocardioides nematodiphilus]